MFLALNLEFHALYMTASLLNARKMRKTNAGKMVWDGTLAIRKEMCKAYSFFSSTFCCLHHIVGIRLKLNSRNEIIAITKFETNLATKLNALYNKKNSLITLITA